MASILALDYGNSRVGVAISLAGFARPLPVVRNERNMLNAILNLIDEHKVEKVVVGLPRNLNGDDTDQTLIVREFAKNLEAKLKLPVYLIDEAATSVEAEQELKARKKPYGRGDVDSLAATLILEDFLENNESE